ncbi:MAG: hypothetical protein V1859_02560 [archaeon]
MPQNSKITKYTMESSTPQNKKYISFLPINKKHLIHLGIITITDQKEFFNLNKKYAHYKKRIYAILLVQGAALHYVDKKNGIKDFDVLVIYKKQNNRTKLYAKRLKSYDSGLPEFGRYSKDKPKYTNRRVDILMREIPVLKHKSLNINLRDFISQHKYWSKKAAVGIWPKRILGKIIYSNTQYL